MKKAAVQLSTIEQRARKIDDPAELGAITIRLRAMIKRKRGLARTAEEALGLLRNGDLRKGKATKLRGDIRKLNTGISQCLRAIAITVNRKALLEHLASQPCEKCKDEEG